MSGKREQSNQRSRLPVVLGLVVLCGLLAAVGGRFGTDRQPPAEQLPTEETPQLPELPAEESVELFKPECYLELPVPGEPEGPVAGIPGLPPLDAPVDPEKPMIAITFDDGPGPYTDRLLDAFATYGGKATFFLVGRNIDSHPETVQRIAAEGHELGSHSWNHPQLPKLGRAAIVEQMTKTRSKIQEVTGVDVDLMRPPYGSVNKSVKSIAAEQGIVLVNWSVDPRDWKLLNADKVYDAVLASAKDGAVILCHDIHETTVEAMERLIPELRVQGYQLVTVTELLTGQGAELNAGTLYRERPEAPAAPAVPAEPVIPAVPDTPLEPGIPAEPAEPPVPQETLPAA